MKYEIDLIEKNKIIIEEYASEKELLKAYKDIPIFYRKYFKGK